MIPHKAHFIYLVDPVKRRKYKVPFGLIYYLSIKSVRTLNPDYELIFHSNDFDYLRESEWFRRCETELGLKTEYQEPIQEVYGNKLNHIVHIVDYCKYLILERHGGAYLDLDTICVSPFDQPNTSNVSLTNADFVLGQVLPEATCAGIIFANNAVDSSGFKFLQMWKDSYKTFRSSGRDKFWSEHSGTIPLKIYLDNFSNDVTVRILTSNVLSPFLWVGKDLKELFLGNVPMPLDAVVCHLWESESWGPYLSVLDENTIKTVDTTYNVVARRFL